MKINIAIDGPAASGKSSAAALFAAKINYHFLDTGIIYRAFTWLCIKNNFSLVDEKALLEALMMFKIKWVDNHLLINGKKPTFEIYSKEVSRNVVVIASKPLIRDNFNKLIRFIVKDKGFVVVGRDITSVVLCDAAIKIFLTSSSKIRSVRRWKEMLKKDPDISFDLVYSYMKERDKADKNRKIGRLTIVGDAIILDNSAYDLATTVSKLLAIYDNFQSEKG